MNIENEKFEGRFLSPKTFFLQLLIPFLKNEKFKLNDHEDYFICLSYLLKADENVRTVVNLEELFELVKNFIRNREIFEERYSDNEDKVLAGFLIIAQTILEIKNEDKIDTEFVNLIFDFLFHMPKNQIFDYTQLNMPKCKKKNTRKRAFNLLIQLCKNEQNFIELLPLIDENHENMENLDLESINIGFLFNFNY